MKKKKEAGNLRKVVKEECNTNEWGKKQVMRDEKGEERNIG